MTKLKQLIIFGDHNCYTIGKNDVLSISQYKHSKDAPLSTSYLVLFQNGNQLFVNPRYVKSVLYVEIKDE